MHVVQTVLKHFQGEFEELSMDRKSGFTVRFCIFSLLANIAYVQGRWQAVISRFPTSQLPLANSLNIFGR